MMRRVGLLIAAAGLLWVSSAPLAAQGVTGLGKSVKSVGDTDPAPLEWTSWTGDEAVDWLVHQPVKSAGLSGGRQAESQIAFKALIVRTEAGVREVFAGLQTGSVSRGTARVVLDEILDEYAAALVEFTSR